MLQSPETLYWHEENLIELLKNLVSDHHCYDVLVEAGASVAGSFTTATAMSSLFIKHLAY